MLVANKHSILREVTGTIQHVDVPRGEVTVLVNGVAHIFDVEPGCSCHLHGERVKLRLLLPKDTVRITHICEGSRFVARSIRVGE